MKKLFRLAAYGCAIIAAFASCSKSDDGLSQKDVETKIIGKWKNTRLDGEEYVTNDRRVLTFLEGGKVLYSMAGTHAYLQNVWYDKDEFSYSVDGTTVNVYGTAGATEAFVTMTVNSISDNKLNSTFTNEMFPTLKYNEEYEKVTVDYAPAIIGLWEGVEFTGDETFGDANHRIKYKEDGTYEYYNKVGEEWVLKEDTFSKYNVDGDWLASQWQNADSEVVNFELWEIAEINNTTMKWTALREREDDTRYTATFTWKKIE